MSHKLTPRMSVIFYLVVIPSMFIVFATFIPEIFSFGSSHTMDVNAFGNIFLWVIILAFAPTVYKFLAPMQKMTSKLYFETYTYDYIITERLFLKKVVFAGILLLILILSITMIQYYQETVDKNKDKPKIGGNQNTITSDKLFLFVALFGIFASVYSGYVKIQNQNKKKDFWLFFASGCFKKAIEENGKSKIYYMTKSLQSYSTHLKNLLNLRIGEIEKINFRILSKEFEDIANFKIKICTSFESGDEYKPLHDISEIMGCSVPEDLLVKESLINKIKEWSAVVVPLITGIWAVIQILLFFLK